MNKPGIGMMFAALALAAAAGCVGTRSLEPLVKDPGKVDGFADGRWVLNCRPGPRDPDEGSSSVGKGVYVLAIRYNEKMRAYSVDGGEALGKYVVAVDRPGHGSYNKENSMAGQTLYGSLTLAPETYATFVDGLSPFGMTFFRPLFLNLRLVPTNGTDYVVSMMKIGESNLRCSEITYTGLSTSELRTVASIGIDPESVGGYRALCQDRAARKSPKAKPVFYPGAILSPTNSAVVIGPVNAREKAELLELKADLAKERAKAL